MNDSDLRNTLIAIGRSPDVFYRDTAMLFMILDNLESVNRRLQNFGHEPERRSDLIMLKNQAE